MRKLFIGVVLLGMMYAHTVTATPSPGFWERAVLLGTNDKFYYYLTITRENPPNYFNFFEKITLIKANSSGEIVEMRFLKETHFFADPTDWKNGSHVATYNAFQYLADEGVKLIFPISDFTYELEIRQNQLLVKKDGKEKILYSKDQFEKYFKKEVLNFDGIQSRVIEIYDDLTIYYLKVKMGKTDSSDEYSQEVIIPVSRQMLEGI